MLSDLNFWDEYKDNFLLSQANKTVKWSGPDNEETFKKVLHRGVKTYSVDSYSYTRNSLGFRSMEFNNSDPVKILYGGCLIKGADDEDLGYLDDGNNQLRLFTE